MWDRRAPFRGSQALIGGWSCSSRHGASAPPSDSASNVATEQQAAARSRARGNDPTSHEDTGYTALG